MMSGGVSGMESSSSSSGSSSGASAGVGVAPFVAKTYGMVDDRATDGVVAWGPAGNSFVVADPFAFSQALLPAHFKHANFSISSGSSTPTASARCTRTAGSSAVRARLLPPRPDAPPPPHRPAPQRRRQQARQGGRRRG
ncbi:hypothetical protein VPH35_075762 [Triticum aestivum]